MSFTLVEAQTRVLLKVMTLALSGIEVRITPTKSRTDECVVKKYKDGLPARLWVSVNFRVKDRLELESVFKAGSELREKGIGFDTGGCKGRRDWELDWSFGLGDGAWVPLQPE